MPFRERVRRQFREIFPRQEHTPVQHELVRQDEAASTPTLPERLWDRAYDELKISDAALIEAYEKILSRKLGAASEQNIIAQNDTHARRRQMRQLIQDGLEKTAGEARIKQAIGAAFVLSAKDMIDAAIQAVPQAALAWTGICVGLEMIQSPIAATEANRRGIEYVIRRMDWYCQLASAALGDNVDKSGPSGVRQELETQIVDLYALLLSYEIKSVCSYYRNRGLALLRDIASLDDWNGDMKAIRDAERAFHDDSNAYANLRMVSNLDQLVIHAETQSKFQLSKEDQQCIKDLRLTDPFDDKKRIEQTKGGLLQESYRWILEHPEYQQWTDADGNRLLWIKGDPGKGKTMLLCGIINELELNRQPSRLGLVSYFFCQATDQQLNNATAALRGLIFMLVRQQPSLISHVRKRYDEAGGKLFEGTYTWVALSDIFEKLIQDPALKGAHLIVDALDECVSDQQQLLDLIVRVSGTEARVKWIVSSRNLSHIEERLRLAKQKVKLSLELNEKSIADAVKVYIREKVRQLSDLKEYDEDTRNRVRDYLFENANETFLWVALVCQNLEKHMRWDVLEALKKFPPGLDCLYDRMMKQVLTGDESHVSLCKQILVVMMRVFRPITLRELGSLTKIRQELLNNVDYLRDIVALCGSFLTIRGDTIYFVHLSAKDHLSANQDDIFAPELENIHRTMVSLSLQAMTRILKKNIYALPYLRLLADDDNAMPEPDPLSAIQYSCVHWVDHLLKESATGAYLEDGGPVCLFLHEHLLHWLEALSLLHELSAGVLSIVALKDLVAAKSPRGDLLSFLQDAHRFVLYSRRGIEIAPLQVYSSALVCSPTQSLVRKAFHREIPSWIHNRPVVQDTWSPCLQTLEGHVRWVRAIAFSADLMQIASGSDDKTIKIWDITTGACIQTLKGHTKAVHTVAFTADGRRIASGSDDQSIKIWDLTTGACSRTLRGHTKNIRQIALLENDQVASASDDWAIKIWDMTTGSCLRTLEDRFGPVHSVALLASGLVVSGGEDGTIRVWDMATGLCNQKLKGHTERVLSLTPSADDQLISGSGDFTVKLWDIATGTCIRTFRGHVRAVMSTAFLASGQLVSASWDYTIKFWDLAKGTCIQTFESHSDQAVVSLSNGQIASGFGHGIKLWDTAISVSAESTNYHQGEIRSIALSSDGRQVATGAADNKIKIWDADTGAYIQTLLGQTNGVTSVSFLTGGLVVAGSEDGEVKLWDVGTGACIRTFEGHDDYIFSMASSPDGRRIASGSADGTVKIWDTATGECVRTLGGDSTFVQAVAVSMDGQCVAGGSMAGCVMIYNEASDSYRKLADRGASISAVAISPDSLYAASGHGNDTIKVWHVAARNCVQTLKVGFPSQLSFHPTMKYRIYSDLGYLDLDLQSFEDESEDQSENQSEDQSELVQSSRPPTPTSPSVTIRGYGVKMEKGWITKDGKPLFWLPPDYRTNHPVVAGATVAVRVNRTRVCFFKFSEAGPNS